MKQASIEAYAKINLTLDVTGKRPNGYHDVCMVMQSIGIHDIVTVQTETGADDIELTISHCDLPTDSSNLAYRAAQLFLQRTNKQSDGIRIHIEKHNPIAAGLAGGSTDAAAVLVLLNDLYQTGLTQEQLMEMGLALGADVPFCIAGGTMLAEGIGEVLTPLPHAPQAFVVLCKPPVAVSTPAIYRAIDSVDIARRPDTQAMLRALKDGDLQAVSALLYNVMQPVTANMHPEIEDICRIMREHGAMNAIMSGSGPTVFGLFADRERAEKARKFLAAHYAEVFLTKFCRAGQVKQA